MTHVEKWIERLNACTKYRGINDVKLNQETIIIINGKDCWIEESIYDGKDEWYHKTAENAAIARLDWTEEAFNGIRIYKINPKTLEFTTTGDRFLDEHVAQEFAAHQMQYGVDAYAVVKPGDKYIYIDYTKEDGEIYPWATCTGQEEDNYEDEESLRRSVRINA